MRLLVRDRTVLDALRNDADLAGPEPHLAVAQQDAQRARQHLEEVVGVVVLVPDEGAADLHDQEVVVVELADDPRLPCSENVARAAFGSMARIGGGRMAMSRKARCRFR